MPVVKVLKTPPVNVVKTIEVRKIVRESSNASCRLDPVPTWLVKSCLDVLAPSITEMVNLSLLSGCVPENWRTAVVIPLLKKPGLDLVYKNFRPVSNLPFISKAGEKAALQQLLVHCEKNALNSSPAFVSITQQRLLY